MTVLVLNEIPMKQCWMIHFSSIPRFIVFLLCKHNLFNGYTCSVIHSFSVLNIFHLRVCLNLDFIAEITMFFTIFWLVQMKLKRMNFTLKTHSFIHTWIRYEQKMLDCKLRCLSTYSSLTMKGNISPSSITTQHSVMSHNVVWCLTE